MDVVCAVIEDGDGRVLACRRPVGKRLGGMWEFPGGKLEAGESAPDALRRELCEELGVEVEVGAEMGAVEHDYGDFAIRLLAYRCRIVGGEPQPHDHDEIRWVGRGEAGALEWAAADVPVLAEWVG